jgi:CO/xanthine dehydrogenase Mo-binding subunit
MSIIKEHLIKRDHFEKVSGQAQYVDDLQIKGLLHGKLLRSTVAKARIKSITLPQLPDGYAIIDYKDVPGKNAVAMVDMDTPIFAVDRVEYISEPILLVVGEDVRVLDQILKAIVVVYEEEEPIFDPLKSPVTFYEYTYSKGDPEKAFKEADRVFEEQLHTGYQEQAYLECQGMIGESDGENIYVHGSMQCPFYLHNALKLALGISDDSKINVKFDFTGGAFGGKEDYPSVLACQVAVAAYKLKRPVKIVLGRREDISTTSKRHPCYMIYRTALKNNKIIGLDIDVTYDGGAYKTLSMVVLQRGLIGACGVYTVPNLKVHGRAVKTNTVPNGAFRGFGGPQTFFGMELHMEHLAQELGYTPLAFKEQYMARQGDVTSTCGQYHDYIAFPEMIAKIDQMSGYKQKYANYSLPQEGRYRKGIGLSLVYHGCGFTGNGERDIIKSKLKVLKHADNTIEILSANTDMGQGLKTTFTEIVMHILQVRSEQVIFVNPQTLKVPNSGPTVASRSMMVVGKLLERACLKLKADWKQGEEQLIEENYIHPDCLIPFTLDPMMHGDAYPTYSWSANVVEVEVDTLTGMTEVLGAWGVYDVGVPIDEEIVRGQMEGGLIQAIGYGGMEQLSAVKGRIRNNSLSDYIIPTAKDVDHLEVAFVENPYPYGPFGAKGAGELPCVGGAPAYIAAVEQALNCRLDHTPVSMEDIIKELEAQNHVGRN